MIATGIYILLGYLLGINLLALLLFGIDKHRAQRNGAHLKQHRRIPESTLLIIALLGGSLGALIGMFTFRHKTKHIKFILLLPLILLFQVALGVYFGTHVNMVRSINVNGVNLVYQVRGRLCAQPVILIHGNGGSHNDLGLMAAQLDSAGYLVIAPDCRGEGANAPLDEYHYADMAEDTYQMIHKLHLRRPYVFGWSDGGIVALMTEMAHPGTFKALITSGANLYPEGVNGVDSITLPQYREENKNASPLFLMMLYEPNIAPEQLSAIMCPALIVAGENDLIREEHTRLIAASIPHGEVMILSGEDHISHIVNNRKMGNILIDYLLRH